MADENNIALNINVTGQGEAGKSLKELKKDYNDILATLPNLKQGTKEYQLALEKLGAVKDDIGDLRDTIGALNPEGKVAAFAKVGSTIASGFAAAQGAAALFGAESEDLQKTMMKVQSAMALAEGIKGIVASADAFKVLNTVVAANPIAAIVLAFAALAATALVVYNNFFKAASASEDLAKQLAKVDEENKHINAGLKAQITALSGLKGNEDEILALKEKGFKLDIERQKLALQVALAKQAEAEASATLEEQLLRASGQEKQADILKFVRLKEQRDATRDAIETLKQSIAGLVGFHNEAEQKKLDVTKELNDKAIQDSERAAKEKAAINKKYIDEQLAYQKQAQDEINKYVSEQDDLGRKRLETKAEENKAFSDADLNDTFFAIDSKDEKVAASEAKQRAEKEKTFNTTVNGTKQALQTTQALTDLFFDYQLKKNKGNAAAELEIRKKQFKVNKAFGIVNAVVDGVGAVQKALNNPYPLNIILAVLSGVLAAANVAKIASSKFEGGETSASADVGSGMTASAPAIPQPNNTTTNISDDGVVQKVKPEPQRVYVVETDIKKSNDRVANIEETAKIG